MRFLVGLFLGALLAAIGVLAGDIAQERYWWKQPTAPTTILVCLGEKCFRAPEPGDGESL